MRLYALTTSDAALPPKTKGCFMIRHILRLWSDDELRPAIKMLSAFIVIATMGIKLGFADSTLLGSFLAAIACRQSPSRSRSTMSRRL